MTKKEKMDFMRGLVIAQFADTLVELVQVDNGSFVAPVTDPDGKVGFVEVKFVVKGEQFDLDQAVAEFARKKADAEKRAKEQAENKAKKAK